MIILFLYYQSVDKNVRKKNCFLNTFNNTSLFRVHRRLNVKNTTTFSHSNLTCITIIIIVSHLAQCVIQLLYVCPFKQAQFRLFTLIIRISLEILFTITPTAVVARIIPM